VTEFNTTIRSERVTVVVTHYEPEILWSREEDQWPAQIEYELYSEEGDQLDWVLTKDENHELLNDYYANELENMG
jgi:hypothetical protein